VEEGAGAGKMRKKSWQAAKKVEDCGTDGEAAEESRVVLGGKLVLPYTAGLMARPAGLLHMV
jgi:hypothetical protein